MRVLVTAASKHGATTEIAAAIGEALQARGLTPTVAAPEAVDDVTAYDAVVLGSGVYAGRWLDSAKQLVERLGEDLAQRPVWLFSSGPVGEPARPEEDPHDVADLVDATGAAGHRLFPGKIERASLGFAERAITAALRVPDGDFRDWDEIAAWAGEIADALSRGD